MVDLDDIKGIGIFQKLEDDEVKSFIGIAKTSTFPKSDTIFEEGDSGKSFFIIYDGKVKITKDVPIIGAQTLKILEKGDYLGEMALLNDLPRYVSAFAETETTLLEFQRDEFNQLLENNKEISYKVLWFFCRTLSNSLRMTNERLQSIFSK
jgi:CRP-like cAMP-binding protein